MIIGLSGFAGSGKDLVSDILVRDHGFVKIALADCMKRFLKEVYDFSDEQLWGPSEERNKPDERYQRKPFGYAAGEPHFVGRIENVPPFSKEGEDLVRRAMADMYLTPRYALQRLGTEFGRDCYPNTWLDYTLRIAKTTLGHFEEKYLEVYTAQKGLHRAVIGDERPQGVVIPDCRFKNEFSAIKKANKIIRIKRTGYENPAWNHPSETEQMEVPDEEFDAILLNDGTISLLESRVATILATLK